VGKGSIAFLPIGKLRKVSAFFYPVAAGYLYFFDIICKRYRRVQVREDMQVVFGAVDAVQMATSFFNNSPNVFI
jgi:hypothetical protein